MQYKGSSVQVFLYLLFQDVKKKKISNTGMKRYAETGSPWRAPLSKLKYWVTDLAFMTNYCRSFNKISIQVMIFFQNQTFLRRK